MKELIKRKLTLRDIINLKKFMKDFDVSKHSNFWDNYDIKLNINSIEKIFELPSGILFDANRVQSEDELKKSKQLYKKATKEYRKKLRSLYIKNEKSIYSKACIISKNSFIEYLSSIGKFYIDHRFIDETYIDHRFMDETCKIYKDRIEKNNSLTKNIFFNITRKQKLFKLYKQKQDSGVYIFYVNIKKEYGLTNEDVILPYYVGKSNGIYMRFNHYRNINPGTWYNKYFNAVWEDAILWNRNWMFHRISNLYFATIYIKDKHEIKLKEHRLLHDFSPIFNVV